MWLAQIDPKHDLFADPVSGVRLLTRLTTRGKVNLTNSGFLHFVVLLLFLACLFCFGTLTQVRCGCAHRIILWQESWVCIESGRRRSRQHKLSHRPLVKCLVSLLIVESCSVPPPEAFSLR